MTGLHSNINAVSGKATHSFTHSHQLTDVRSKLPRLSWWQLVPSATTNNGSFLMNCRKWMQNIADRSVRIPEDPTQLLWITDGETFGCISPFYCLEAISAQIFTDLLKSTIVKKTKFIQNISLTPNLFTSTLPYKMQTHQNWHKY